MSSARPVSSKGARVNAALASTSPTNIVVEEQKEPVLPSANLQQIDEPISFLSNDAEIKASAEGAITSKPVAERGTVMFTSEGHVMYAMGTRGIVVVNPIDGES